MKTKQKKNLYSKIVSGYTFATDPNSNDFEKTLKILTAAQIKYLTSCNSILQHVEIHLPAISEEEMYGNKSVTNHKVLAQVISILEIRLHLRIPLVYNICKF